VVTDYAEAIVKMDVFSQERVPSWEADEEGDATAEEIEQELAIPDSTPASVPARRAKGKAKRVVVETDDDSMSGVEESPVVVVTKKGKGRMVLRDIPAPPPISRDNSATGSKRALQDSPTRVDPVPKRPRASQRVATPAVVVAPLDLGSIEVLEGDLVPLDMIPALVGKVRSLYRRLVCRGVLTSLSVVRDAQG
jgi:hypothetical protein